MLHIPQSDLFPFGNIDSNYNSMIGLINFSKLFLYFLFNIILAGFLSFFLISYLQIQDKVST